MNREIELLASSARTAAITSDDQHNADAKGVIVIIDTTVDPGTASVTPTIQGKDPVSGKYYTLLTGAAIAAVGTIILRVHPELTAAANLVAKDALPATWRFSMAVADAESLTYSVSAITVK